MNKRLDTIRAKAIETREKLSYANADEQSSIAKLDKIIRGAPLVKWMFLFSTVVSIVFAAVFTYSVYPDAQFMLLMLGIAAGGYAICFFGIVVQMKLYNRTIAKVRSALTAEHETLVKF